MEIRQGCGLVPESYSSSGENYKNVARQGKALLVSSLHKTERNHKHPHRYHGRNLPLE